MTFDRALTAYRELLKGDEAFLAELDPAIQYVLDSMFTCKMESSRELKNATYLVDYAWEQLHACYYKDVSRSTRILYTISAYLKYLGLLNASEGLDPKMRHANYREMMGCLDRILLMVDAPILRQEVFDGLKSTSIRLGDVERELLTPVKLYPDLRLARSFQAPALKNPIPRVHCDDLALTEYKRLVSEQKTPFIITNALEFWPALSDDETNWSNLNRLFKLLGKHRTVPVEVGRAYTDTQWTQKLATVEHFFDEYLLNEDLESPRGYLAQHDLFNQIPELLAEIAVPAYCSLATGCDHDDDDDEFTPVVQNIWLGPCNTVSPLHTDPQNNLLAQIFGHKYVRLYSPKDSSYLYPFDADNLMSNTSQVDAEACDMEMFPLFSRATLFDAVLVPGDLLYEYLSGFRAGFRAYE